MSVLDLFRLDGRVAIVTGASAGLGVGLARGLAEAGADVALGARRLDLLRTTEQVVRDAGRRALSVRTDVTEPTECEHLVEMVVEEFGRVDILMNNAGAGSAVPALKETPEEFWRVLEVNVGGMYWMAQAAARRMQPGSSITNVASIGAMISFGTPQAAYAASKSAVVGLTRDLAAQWTRRRGIRVNALAPGFVETDLTREWFAMGGYDRDQAHLVPVGRPGRVEEIASAAVFLASEAASYVTGTMLVVDGGRTLH